MTVRELIEALKHENLDAAVVYRDDGDYYLASGVFRCQVDRTGPYSVRRRLQSDPVSEATVDAVEVI